ncbi:DUF1178 family protein [Roseicyclus mahoneyensis]|jgi:hypothetical protein|uniref:DUF1178 family protein n=1 Tax=Roseicyclus mahoneyensis TaxID=164332 RepID=A0A316GWY5_9RHOB|nr:DUF1178 family protein [Roseicyclus mahoneyensis]PWK59589.1 hypothetical protein C7455_107134 [Roseicyclus mahoneyensis]
MIRYALRCSQDHSFDSWFQSAAAYDALAAKGLVSCAICGGSEVTKALMAPRVAGTDAPEAPLPARPLSEPAHPAEQMLRVLKEHLAKNSTYVGGRFASEARAMHLGEADARPIHGEAAPEEARALIEEGIAIAPLPILPPDKTN